MHADTVRLQIDLCIRVGSQRSPKGFDKVGLKLPGESESSTELRK